VDPDILTDKMGLEEMSLPNGAPYQFSSSKDLSSLTPVNERLSDETLDDVHAFSNLHISFHTMMNLSTTATAGSVASSSNASFHNPKDDLYLETLDEDDAEDDDSINETMNVIVVMDDKMKSETSTIVEEAAAAIQ